MLYWRTIWASGADGEAIESQFPGIAILAAGTLTGEAAKRSDHEMRIVGSRRLVPDTEPPSRLKAEPPVVGGVAKENEQRELCGRPNLYDVFHEGRSHPRMLVDGANS
jgi:hypothetical protein